MSKNQNIKIHLKFIQELAQSLKVKLKLLSCIEEVHLQQYSQSCDLYISYLNIYKLILFIKIILLHCKIIANYLIKKEQYEEATLLLERILETDPDFADAFYLKGIIELSQSHLQEAKKYFQIFLEKFPNHALALNEIASIMIKEKEYKEALIYLEKGFQANPNIPDINYGLGTLKFECSILQQLKFTVMFQQDQNEKVRQQNILIWRQIRTQNKNIIILVKRVLYQIQNNMIMLWKPFLMPQKLILNILMDIKYQLTYIVNQNNMIRCKKHVIKFLIQIIKTNMHQIVNKNSNKKYHQNIDVIVLIILQPQVPQVQTSVEDQLKQVQVMQVEQQSTQALSLLNLILEKDPVQLQALKLKAQIQIELKQQASCLVTLDQILKIQQNDIYALKEKVKILEYLNKNEEVLKCYELILNIETSFELLEKKASTLIKLDRIQEASKIYEQLSSQSSQDDSKIFIIRGRLLQTQKKYDDAITCLNNGLNKFPQNLEILNLLALIYKTTNQQQKALEIYEKLLNIEPTNEQYLYEKGLILFNLNNFNDSFDIFIQLKKNEYTQNLNYYLGICYNEKKQYIETLKYLSLYIKIGKENLEKVYSIIGNANLFLMKFDEAIDGYKSCIKQNPNNSDAYFQLGNVYKQDKQMEEAQKSFEQAVKIDPQNSLHKQALDNIINEKSYLQEYRNSLLFTLITFIGCCYNQKDNKIQSQLDPKQQDFEKKQNEKYLTLLTLMEAHLKKRFNTLDKHFEQLKQLIGKSYDMKLTLIDDTLFPIIQFWHNQKICKKKKDDNDLVVSMIQIIKFG